MKITIEEDVIRGLIKDYILEHFSELGASSHDDLVVNYNFGEGIDITSLTEAVITVVKGQFDTEPTP